MIILKYSLLVIITCFCLNAHAQNSDSVSVMKSTEKFLSAFKNFNWPVFRESFDTSATIFYPEWQLAKRKAGKAEIEKTWLEMFPEFTDKTNTAKLEISPKDIFVQLYGETAIVSFHLGDGRSQLSRRTLVLVKRKNNWKIVHLHASSLVEDKKK